MRLAILAIPLLLAALPARAQTWLAESEQTLPSGNSGWGGLAIDPAANRLLIARRDDGLLAWDTLTRKPTTVPDSKGANAVVLAPGRAFVPMQDGAVLMVELATMTPLGRIDPGVGDLVRGFYEPTQNRVYLITGPRAEKTVWVSLDAATGDVLGRTEFNSKEMDTPAAVPAGVPGSDGKGAVFAIMRDRNLLQQLDAKDLSLQKTWRLGDCTQPVAVQWDPAAERVLIACRGDKPVFVALNPGAGVVATVPIGRGAGAMALDPERHLVVTANGIDGTMSVIRQDSPDAYALVETIATRPMARLLQRDPASGRLFSVTASFTEPAPDKDGKTAAPFYHPDSFTILSYRSTR